MNESAFFRSVLAGTTGMLLFLACATLQSQDLSQTLNVSPSDSDNYAVSLAQDMKQHARLANTPAGKAARPSEVSNLHSADAGKASDQADGSHKGVRYPGDLQYHGGPVVTSTQQHLIYVNLATSTSCHTVATCWGDPHQFLHDLGDSDFIHVVDQYVNEDEDDRYTVSNTAANVTIANGSKPLTNANILAIVHLVASFFGAGYGNVYHVFFLPGQDVCFDSTLTVCYSPDKPSTFIFCAYHGSATFKDIGHVLYSVEPFQNVDGCDVRPTTPNGQLIDSTNNVLSHETIETITDPDGSAWWNSLNNALYGQEIADECSFLLFTKTSVFFDPSNVHLNGNKYAIQPEYNNNRHACTTAP